MKNKQNIETLELIYLDLLKKSLTRYISDNGYSNLLDRPNSKVKTLIFTTLNKILSKKQLEIVKHKQFNPAIREIGKDWPSTAETMIGLQRLDNIQQCIDQIITQKIPGDFIETGVWRGGATIFMRGVLKAKNINNRTIWCADSFEGLPKPSSASHREDVKDELWKFQQLAVSMEDVKNNFKKYNLLDDHVKFLKGWFNNTLPTAPIKRLALIRLDGDMYESTMDALEPLYPKLSKGGFVIVDDYCLPACREAIHDFRNKYNITAKLHKIDWASIYWQKD